MTESVPATTQSLKFPDIMLAVERIHGRVLTHTGLENIGPENTYIVNISLDISIENMCPENTA